jgi:hypothetical protein
LTRRARSGRRSFGMRRPSHDRSFTRARATCWRCSARACWKLMWYCPMRRKAR